MQANGGGPRSWTKCLCELTRMEGEKEEEKRPGVAREEILKMFLTVGVLQLTLYIREKDARFGQ